MHSLDLTTKFNFSQVVISFPTKWIPKKWQLTSGLRPSERQPLGLTIAAGPSGAFSGQETGASQHKKISATSIYSQPGGDPLSSRKQTTSMPQEVDASFPMRHLSPAPAHADFFASRYPSLLYMDQWTPTTCVCHTQINSSQTGRRLQALFAQYATHHNHYSLPDTSNTGTKQSRPVRAAHSQAMRLAPFIRRKSALPSFTRNLVAIAFVHSSRRQVIYRRRKRDSNCAVSRAPLLALSTPSIRQLSHSSKCQPTTCTTSICPLQMIRNQIADDSRTFNVQ